MTCNPPNGLRGISIMYNLGSTFQTIIVPSIIGIVTQCQISLSHSIEPISDRNSGDRWSARKCRWECPARHRPHRPLQGRQRRQPFRRSATGSERSQIWEQSSRTWNCPRGSDQPATWSSSLVDRTRHETSDPLCPEIASSQPDLVPVLAPGCVCFLCCSSGSCYCRHLQDFSVLLLSKEEDRIGFGN